MIIGALGGLLLKFLWDIGHEKRQAQQSAENKSTNKIPCSSAFHVSVMPHCMTVALKHSLFSNNHEKEMLTTSLLKSQGRDAPPKFFCKAWSSSAVSHTT